MAIDTAHVSRDQHVGGQRGVLSGHAQLLKDGLHYLAQVVRADADGVALFDAEDFEHGFPSFLCSPERKDYTTSASGASLAQAARSNSTGSSAATAAGPSDE